MANHTLILARKAAAVGRPEALGSWLYRVAVRAALHARQQAGTYRPLERLYRQSVAADAPAQEKRLTSESLLRQFRVYGLIV